IFDLLSQSAETLCRPCSQPGRARGATLVLRPCSSKPGEYFPAIARSGSANCTSRAVSESGANTFIRNRFCAVQGVAARGVRPRPPRYGASGSGFCLAPIALQQASEMRENVSCRGPNGSGTGYSAPEPTRYRTDTDSESSNRGLCNGILLSNQLARVHAHDSTELNCPGFAGKLSRLLSQQSTQNTGSARRRHKQCLNLTIELR